jgi:hypothetical protein
MIEEGVENDRDVIVDVELGVARQAGWSNCPSS